MSKDQKKQAISLANYMEKLALEYAEESRNDFDYEFENLALEELGIANGLLLATHLIKENVLGEEGESTLPRRWTVEDIKNGAFARRN